MRSYDVEMRYVAGRRVAIWQMPKDLAAARRVFPWDVLPYCDDFLIVVHGGSKLERAVREREAKAVIEGAIERLGLTRQTEKGQWTPGSWIHHLGLRIESEGGSNRIAVTPQRVGRIRKAAKTLLSKAKGNKRLVKARELAGFVGLVQSCYLAIPVAQLFCRELNFDLAEKESWSGSTRLSRQSLRTQSKMDSFLQVVLQQQGVEAPAGFSYSYHSLRKMAASSIKCIGVSDQRLQFFGRWKDIATANDRYVDAACQDTYGCYRLFGHLLPAADRLCGVAKRRDDMCQW
eukprot:COSAG06_NODE_90_length_24779_cov_33.515843_21_plen_289_part_00